MGHIRTFIAIEIPELIIEEISRVQNELKRTQAQVGWVKPGNIHITLKFLGNTDESKISDIAGQIKKSVAGIPPFEIMIQGIGVFPNFRRPRVVWIGTGHNDQLLKLAKNIDTNMSHLGFEKENRPFKAHLTLGRVKGIRGMHECLDVLRQNNDFKGGSFLADYILLIKSELKPTGAVYTPLKKIKLEL